MRRSAQTRARSVRTAAYVLAMGTVTWCVSEPVFWARLTGEGNDPGDAVFTWTLYCGVTYLALIALRHFWVAGLAGFFLVGAILGWLIEGAVVPELYTDLPVSIVFTALAWHALVTVCAGWWLLPAVLRRGGWRAWVACGGAGIVWALWSLDPVLDEDVATLSGPGFVVLSCGVTAALVTGYWLAGRYRPDPHALAPGIPLVLVGLGIGAWATAATFVPVPYAPPILAALLGLAIWALRRLRPPDGASAIDTRRVGGVPLRRLAPLMALASCASVANLALGAAEVTVPAVAIVFIVLTTTAIVVLALTIRLALRSPSGRGGARGGAPPPAGGGGARAAPPRGGGPPRGGAPPTTALQAGPYAARIASICPAAARMPSSIPISMS